MAEIASQGVAQSYAFGPFRLVPDRQLLLHDGQSVRIGGRALDILTALVEQPGETVSKRDLIDRVWPNVLVDDSNLKVNMNALRRALGEGTGSPQYIATVVGRGYRFIAPVTTLRLPDWATAPKSPSPARHNLPAATTRIVGRDNVIAATRADLDQARLVSIVGPGGSGKTTVALAIAEQMLGLRRDGVWLVDLASVADSGFVPDAIATSIGLTAQSAHVISALGEYLREKDMLLLLDSCEHVIGGVADTVSDVIVACSGVRVLATSREPLGLKHERVHRLAGLAVPTEMAALTAAEAMRFAAIQLFADRATDHDESFTLSDADAPAAGEICRRLDGLALGIELAATHVATLGVTGLLQALDDRFRLLENRRGGPDRQRTLLATIQWSHALLSPSEQFLLRRLAIFAGSFNLEDACTIASEDERNRHTIIANLSRLVSKSLLAGELRDSQLEYRMLDSTRAFARDQLSKHGDHSAAHRRHAEWALGLLDLAKLNIDRMDRRSWLARYAGHVDDIRAALNWAFTSSGNGALGIRLTIASIPFCKQMSLIEECRVAAERALDDRLAPFRTPRDDLILNLTLGATLLHARGPLLEVKQVLTRALGLAEQIGDTTLQLECLRGLSEYELWTGDSRSAMAIAERIRSLTDKGEKAAAGDADAQAGSALSWLGALGAARHRLEGIVQRPSVTETHLDDVRFDFDQRLIARGSLATVLWLQGYADQAVETARRQLADAEASNYAVSLCYSLVHGSAVIAMYVRDYTAAYAYIDRGIEHATRHGLTIWRAMAAGPRARLDLYLGKPIDLAAFRRTLAEVREGGFRMRYANYLTNYAEAVARQVDLNAGLDLIDEAVTFSEGTGQVVGIPEILRIKGHVIRFQAPGRWQEAIACYERSIELARRDHALGWELRSSMDLVKLWRLHGGNAEAEAALAACYVRFTEGFTIRDLRRARALIDSAPV